MPQTDHNVIDAVAVLTRSTLYRGPEGLNFSNSGTPKICIVGLYLQLRGVAANWFAPVAGGHECDLSNVLVCL